MKQTGFEEYRKEQQVWPHPFYTEGPVVDAAGDLFVTNLQGGQILRMTQNGIAEEWASSACPNGQMIAAGGDHWVCDSYEACVKRFDPSGKFSGILAAGPVSAHIIRCPNDLADDREGGFFFTDSVRHTGFVCHVDRRGKKRIIADHLDYPNGIALHPVTNHLFVAESYQNRILMVDLDRISSAPVVFCNLPVHPSGNAAANLPDGLAFDRSHHLWVAHYGMAGVQVLNEQGEWVGKLETGFPLTSNVYIGEELLLVTGGAGEPGPGFIQVLKNSKSET